MNIRKVTKRSRKSKPSTRQLDITVVDAHHHVLRPIWEAIKTGKMPRSGNKFLHFDSHPDMAVFGADTENDRSKGEVREMRELLRSFHKGSFDEQKAIKYHEIATWVPTLAFQGIVDEVIWCAGFWCDQIPVGSYDLVVGISKVTGTMKLATPDNRRSVAWGYWQTDHAWCPVEELECTKPWKLHVVKFNKSFQLPEQGVDKIVKVCRGKPWFLDIDLDYLSCQNPLQAEFCDFFGEATWKRVEYIWDVCPHPDYQNALEEIIRSKSYKLTPAKYLKHEAVQKAVDALMEHNLTDIWKGAVTRKKSEDLMAELRQIIHKASFNSTDEDLWEFYAHGPGWLITAGGFIGIPHHISTQQEIIKMLYSTGDLFKAIRTPPRVATIATSIADSYTPDLQAPIIVQMMLDLLENQWFGSSRVFRQDFTNGLSINTEGTQGLALFLSKGKSTKEPKKLKAPSK